MAVKTKFFKSKATKKSNIKSKELPLKECINMNTNVNSIHKSKSVSISDKNPDLLNKNTTADPVDNNRVISSEDMYTEPTGVLYPEMDLKTRLMERIRLENHKLKELRYISNKVYPIREDMKNTEKPIKKESSEHKESLLAVLDAFIKEKGNSKKRRVKKTENKKATKKIETKLINKPVKPKTNSGFLEIHLPKSLLASFEESVSFNVKSNPSPPSFDLKEVEEVNTFACHDDDRKQEIYEKYNKRFYFDGFKIHKNPYFKYKTDIYGKPVVEKYDDLPVIHSPIPERRYITLEEFERIEYKLELIEKKLEFE